MGDWDDLDEFINGLEEIEERSRQRRSQNANHDPLAELLAEHREKLSKEEALKVDAFNTDQKEVYKYMEKPLNTLFQLAEKNDKYAQYALSYLYGYGIGVERDY